MDREDRNRRETSFERFSADPGVPMYKGQGQDALESRRRALSHASWPGEPRRVGEGRSLRKYGSERPGASRERDAEVERNGLLDGERETTHSRRTAQRCLRTPARWERERSLRTGQERRRRSLECTPRSEDEVTPRRESRCNRKRSRSPSRDLGESQPSCSKQYKCHDTSTDTILDKFLSILQSVKGSDKPRMTFNTNIVPEFDPMSKEQTILTWLTKVEECAGIYGWEDKETIHYALPKLTGLARSWYQNLPTMLFTWSEWKNKLIESFPVREDYAELLTEMLAKRVKYGESLDHYYYAKINLLNRCQIYGRQAVDCLLHGVDDRAIRVGAQAAQFSDPEKVLKYFRTVKVGQSRENHESSSKFRNERRNTTSFAKSGGSKPDTTKIICYNCDQFGHPRFKCDKPPAKCTTCDKSGHLSVHCYRNKTNKSREGDTNQLKDNKEKQVAQLNIVEEVNAKYKLNIKVNGNVVDCHLDLGSQCSLITLSKAREFNLDIVVPEDLPTLRGIGNNLTNPVGMTTVSVEVQNITQTINMYVVDDYVISQSVLLGHSFTEKPDIIITKTPTAVIFQQIPSTKVHLEVSKDIDISPNTLRAVQVLADSKTDVRVYVNGSIRGPVGSEYYLLPGDYEVKGGRSALLVHNASSSVINLKRGTLLARVYPKSTDKGNPEDTLQSCNVSFCEIQNEDDFNHGDNLTPEELMQLKLLLQKHSDCFSSGLHDLGFTDLTEMVIELDNSEPVVYRPYRMSFADRALVRNMIQEMVDHGIVRESTSPYASPIVLVQKKTGDKRLCVDYRELNRKTKKEHYPLPRIEDQLDQLAGNTVFTSLDLASGYYQIAIAEES
ncbi:uncharacterized protein LOC135117240 [Helicoverpa armigera]|uniref:uncharacterized protein LOC135117240 n=1 Tax=Helicoverpa armigera TaxID=29058 RepID=UPI003083CE14